MERSGYVVRETASLPCSDRQLEGLSLELNDLVKYSTPRSEYGFVTLITALRRVANGLAPRNVNWFKGPYKSTLS